MKSVNRTFRLDEDLLKTVRELARQDPEAPRRSSERTIEESV